ncbi:MAG: SH3 domain-containing protein [Nitrospirota bacterium]|nr:SH3 domain-containing protein [Nitrospirota bacterium]
MAALVGNLTSVGNPFNWTLLFARQPEPDLEFTEEELDQTTATKATGPLNPRKKSGGGRPILWILLLALVGGITYVSTMEPEKLTEWLSPYLGESTPPPMAMKPKPVAPAPVAPPEPAPQSAPSPSDEASAPLAPATSPTNAVVPAAPAVVPPPQTAARPAAPVALPLTPMFSEGQKVTVTVDETAPGGSIPLFADSSSSKPGPIVRPGVTLTVLDGDLQAGNWMYLVRTDEGAKGWVSEKRLRLKF